MTPRSRPENQQESRDRRRARWTMRILTGICVLIALSIGVTQLASKGFQAFVDRPPGVGASEGNESDLQAEPASRDELPELRNEPPEQLDQPEPLDPEDFLAPDDQRRDGPRGDGPRGD